MDTYSARLFATLFSVVLILTASIVFIKHQGGKQIDGDDTPPRNGEDGKLSDTLLFQKFNKQNIDRFKSGPVLKQSLGETVYYNSEIYNYLRTKTRRELELAGAQRKKECGTFFKYSAIDCDICILFVNGLRALVDQGSTQEDVAVFATKVCKDLKIEDDRVCDAITQEYKAMLFGVITRLVLSPKEACGLVIGGGCGDPYDPYSFWNVTLPDVPKPPVVPPQPPAPGSPTLRVLHITDYHLDTDYAEGSNAECGEPLCCRADDGPPAKGHAGAGKYGDYRGCDAVRATVENLFQHLNSIQDQFDFVYFTGDIPAHNIWNQSRSDQIARLKIYTDMVKKYLPDKMVYNAIGNHESAPANSFPPPYISGNQSEKWYYDALAASWENWLPPETLETILRGAFYTHSPFPGFRVISLNMNFCNTGNWWLLINTTDPAGQLQWLIGQLQDAEDKGDKVHIIGHVFPGCACCLVPYSWNYYKIINRYENTVVGQFFGHAHTSFYEVFYDDVNFTRPISVMHIPGSITTYTSNNPGYRIYEMDGNYSGSSWRVQDFTNYYLNLTDANLTGRLKWLVEYNAKKEYGLQNLFPSDWNQLIYRMKDDDVLFQKFHSHYYKMAPHTPCTGACKKSMLCDLKTGRSGDTNLCKDL